MIIISFLFVTPVVTALIIVVSPHWFYIFLFPFSFFVSLFIHQMFQGKVHKIINIGVLNEDGWREFEFKKQNPEKKPKYTIGFIGDIMKMGEYTLKFEKRIQKFFKGVDLIVGNLEGIILKEKTTEGGIATQNHNTEILTQLKGMVFEPDKSKWLLSVSNNHSADFGDKEFKNSRDCINKEPNFYAFGDLDIDESHSAFPWDSNQLMDDINIVTGTMWTNRDSEDLFTRFNNKDDYHKPGKFNIFFPHWHYENESYVRSKIQRKSISLFLNGEYKERNWYVIYKLIEHFHPFKKIIRHPLVQRGLKFIYRRSIIPTLDEKQKWDLIFGHHPHVPQPIKNYGKGIIVFSGGNFTSSQRRKKHISGLIMKCEICKAEKLDELELGKVHWCYTRNERNKKKEKVKVIVDCQRTRKKSFESHYIKFKASLIIFSIALGIWLVVFGLLGTINYLYWLIYFIVIIALVAYFILKYIDLHQKYDRY
jgi:hypothetical protein